MRPKSRAGIEGPFHIVANLPYNVGTALFVGWLGGEAWPPQWPSLTLMFQQEVAQRIVAPKRAAMPMAASGAGAVAFKRARSR
jgi:16S rRNA A1518/A1519 N6-dimethyltransferase RsmA/KsgA/DIM1 with predicted DNA glycosylase/AP lyase activity